MRFLLAVALAAGVLLLPTARAFACDCALSGPAESAERADAVFAGRVVGERDIAGAEPRGETVYTFAVDGVAKGEVGPSIDVIAGGDSDMCGTAFTPDHRWLVFAGAEDGVLRSGLCSGSFVLEPGAAAPFELVEPVTEPSPDTFDVPVPFVVVLGTAAFVILASWVAFRRTAPR